MRLELVLIGVALALVGALFSFTSEYHPPDCEANFVTGWRCTGGSVSRAYNPMGIALVVTGISLAVLGAVLPSPASERAVAHHAPPSAAPRPQQPPPPPQQQAAAQGITVTGGSAPPPAAPAPAPAPAAAPGTSTPPPSGAAATGTSDAPESLTPGSRILDGKFEVVRALGQGTFGGTFLARDLLLDRLVVLKELLPQWRDDPRIRARFEREAKVVANLDHPYVVDLYGVERWGEGLLLVMEHVDGGSLSERLRDKGRLAPQEALEVVDQVLQALEAVHAKGILHRDVKPSNVLLTGAGEARLADFGVAHAPEYGATMEARAPGASHPGSVPFMAPEQVAGLDLDASSDLYSLTATLYYLVVGEPYVSLTGKTQEAMRRTVLEEPPRLPVEGLSNELNAFLAKGLAKKPADRFASAADMRAWLPER